MGQNTTWTYEDCARSTVIRDRTRHLRWSGVVPRARPAAPLGSAPVILRWSGGLWLVQPSPPGPRPLPCGGQDWYMPQACAGRRHVRPSYHTGGTEITILLALDARGHVTVAPTSSGLTA